MYIQKKLQHANHHIHYYIFTITIDAADRYEAQIKYKSIIYIFLSILVGKLYTKYTTRHIAFQYCWKTDMNLDYSRSL